jgi:2-amino-4-hydroxy-6-hydroxymethyldihydropteridine diphosphokinase
MPRAFISVGSNINAEANVRAAVRLLSEAVRIVGVSTFYATEPIGRPEQPTFYNGVLEVETDIPPRDLKQSVLRRIEHQLGRERTEDRYAARTIDLDVLLYDDQVQDSADLVLPDPDVAARAFLAVPLCELAPDLVLPGSGRSIQAVAARFAGHQMKPLREYTDLLREEAQHGS